MMRTDTELSQLLDAARAWAAEDPDPRTAAELTELLERAVSPDPAAQTELADRFDGTLQFGTAGLRAAQGAGPNRMNRVVVRRAAAGLAAFLLDTAAGDYAPRAVVGYDARHNSEIFAAETAAIFTAAGIDTYLLPAALPTPILAYAVRALGAEAGVMVTASHNPARDNGYKVYLGGRSVDEHGRGVQIVAPFDARIAERIEAVGPLHDIQLANAGWTVLDPDIEDDYVHAVAALAQPDGFPARALKLVLTPLHGVGGRTALKVLAAAGFNDVTMVAAQAEPDPDFPTVAFPNPEEPGALDLAQALAEEIGADMVLATDPDADRAAVAGRGPDTGLWRMLRGDEVGALLGAHLVRRLDASGPRTGTREQAGLAALPAPVFANSIVSSRMLAKVAQAAGIEHRQTLTGFKWISRVPGLTYGYEEALGYCVAPGLVRDKDGISAGLLLAELAADLRAGGETVFDALDRLALEHGVHLSDQLAVRADDLTRLSILLDRLRAAPPATFAGSPVSTAIDLSLGSGALPPTEGLLYETETATRVIVRPSGTEPKLKCYLEVIEPVSPTDSLTATKDRARSRLDTVMAELRAALGV